MLRQLRKHSRHFLIYIFFGIIIAFFVVNFGPQSQGCTASTETVGTIGRTKITQNDFQYVMSVAGLSDRGGAAQLNFQKSMLMDHFLLRELLAEEAMRLGMRVGDDEIHAMLLKGRYLALGQTRALHEEGEALDYDRLSKWVRYAWGVTVTRFIEQQRRELLAEKLRTALRVTTKALDSDVKAEFVQSNTQVKLEYVRFLADDYLSQIDDSAEALAKYAEAHKDELQKHFEDNKKTRYSALPKQIKLSLLATKTQPVPQKDGETTPDSLKDALKNLAKQRLTALRKRVEAGEAWEKVASDSDDPSAARGGLLSWRPEKSLTLAEKVKTAIAGLKDGELSPVLEDKDRFVVVRVEGRREGDLTFEQVRDDLARERLRKQDSLQKAQSEADRYAKRLAGGEKWEVVFEVETKDEPDPQDKGQEAPDKPAANKEKRPEAKATPLFARSGDQLVPGIGISKEISTAAFEAQEGTTLAKPYAINRTIFVVRVAEKKDPDPKEYEKTKGELVESYELRTWSESYRRFASNLCKTAVADNVVAVNSFMVTPPTQQQQGKIPVAPENPYSPCASLELGL